MLRPIASRLLTRSVRRYHGSADFKPPTMDQLPVPQGCWKTKHDADQRHNNAVLLAGVSFLVGTIVVGKTTGMLYLNFYPPESLD